jgi:hypothetical protein
VNLVILTFNLVGMRAAAAAVPEVLRARSLEIVDAQGRARATLNIQAAGNGHSEVVLLRLINERQRPAVKISTSEEGSGLMLAGGATTHETYAVVDSTGTTTQLRLRNEDGRDQLIKP